MRCPVAIILEEYRETGICWYTAIQQAQGGDERTAPHCASEGGLLRRQRPWLPRYLCETKIACFAIVVEDKVCSARGQNWRKCGEVEEEIRLFVSPPFGEAIPNAGIPERNLFTAWPQCLTDTDPVQLRLPLPVNCRSCHHRLCESLLPAFRGRISSPSEP